MSISWGYTTFTVCIAKLFTDARSFIEARRRCECTPYVTERILMSSLAISWPVIDLDNICMRIKRCSNVHYSPIKRTMTTNASPSREVPSKITERCFPLTSFLRRASSSFNMNGTRSNMCRRSVRRYIGIFFKNIPKAV